MKERNCASLYFDELYHYGVKGQKWGVRRYQNKDGTLTNAGKVRYSKTHMELYNGQTRDHDIVIKKGSEFSRVQNTSSLSSGQKYVSRNSSETYGYLTLDVNGDSGKLGLSITDKDYNEGTDNTYLLKLKTTEDIKIPSYKKSVETATEAFSKKKEEHGLTKYEKNIYKTLAKSNDPYSKETYAAYSKLAKSFMRDSEVKDNYFNLLKEKGYNAIIDEEDTPSYHVVTNYGPQVSYKSHNSRAYLDLAEYKRSRYISNSATIVMDSNSLEVVKSHKITKDEARAVYEESNNIQYKNEATANGAKALSEWFGRDIRSI